jgi:hypothetical protein
LQKAYIVRVVKEQLKMRTLAIGASYIFIYFVKAHIYSYVNKIQCEISGSHSGKYEVQSLLGCTNVFLIGWRPTYQRCVVAPTTRCFLGEHTPQVKRGANQ